MNKNTNGAIAPPQPKLILLALAAAAAAFVILSLASPALAGSGGVSTDGNSGGAKLTKKQSAASKARYKRLWNKVGSRDRRWARRTSACESGGNPKAIGGRGRYRGAFQFMKATWRVAPKSPGGDPIVFTYRTQAVVAVALKRRDGRGHWPSCG